MKGGFIGLTYVWFHLFPFHRHERKIDGPLCLSPQQTVLLSPAQLHAVFTPAKMRPRAERLAVLGMSLSSLLLDTNSAQDYLRGLLSLLSEFDNIGLGLGDENMVNISSGSISSGSGGGNMSVADVDEFGFTGGGGGYGSIGSAGIGEGNESGGRAKVVRSTLYFLFADILT